MASTPSDVERAKNHFVTLLTKYPNHSKVPDGMYKLGTVFKKMGDTTKARVTFKRVVKDYSNSQAAKFAAVELKSL